MNTEMKSVKPVPGPQIVGWKGTGKLRRVGTGEKGAVAGKRLLSPYACFAVVFSFAFPSNSEPETG